MSIMTTGLSLVSFSKKQLLRFTIVFHQQKRLTRHTPRILMWVAHIPLHYTLNERLPGSIANYFLVGTQVERRKAEVCTLKMENEDARQCKLKLYPTQLSLANKAIKVPRQTNGHDCGAFSCIFMICLVFFGSLQAQPSKSLIKLIEADSESVRLGLLFRIIQKAGSMVSIAKRGRKRY